MGCSNFHRKCILAIPVQRTQTHSIRVVKQNWHAKVIGARGGVAERTNLVLCT